ncbi:unnamed protein product [Prorocentrum cordatum]|uniref:Uncharacterized protein n=1 Tax=Prorocentrum cordatum TaxID=2364126 RepID=A0ABN9WEP2_9DINO|nr:unnamed protein product [Polarella glacialis]
MQGVQGGAGGALGPLRRPGGPRALPGGRHPRSGAGWPGRGGGGGDPCQRQLVQACPAPWVGYHPARAQRCSLGEGGPAGKRGRGFGHGPTAEDRPAGGANPFIPATVVAKGIEYEENEYEEYKDEESEVLPPPASGLEDATTCTSNAVVAECRVPGGPPRSALHRGHAAALGCRALRRGRGGAGPWMARRSAHTAALGCRAVHHGAGPGERHRWGRPRGNSMCEAEGFAFPSGLIAEMGAASAGDAEEVYIGSRARNMRSSGSPTASGLRGASTRSTRVGCASPRLLERPRVHVRPFVRRRAQLMHVGTDGFDRQEAKRSDED